MDWASIGGGLGGVAGGAMQYFMDEQMMRQQEDFNRDEAEKNRTFQEQMSNTAHQREVMDLKAAGLNPIISAGGGASTPSGSSGTAALQSASSLGLEKIMSSAQAYRQGEKALEAAQASIDATKSQKDVSDATARVRNAEAAVAEANAASAPSIKAFNEKYSDYLGPLSVLMPMIGQGASTARDVGIFGAAAKNLLGGGKVFNKTYEDSNPVKGFSPGGSK